MKKLPVLLFFLFPLCAQAQKTTPVDLNTVYAFIDSTTYLKLFENPFVRDTLFECVSKSSKTNTDTYGGKYMFGQSSLLEFMRPGGAQSFGPDGFGSVGIEFTTRALHDLTTYVKIADQHKIATQVDSIVLNKPDGTKVKWHVDFGMKDDKNYSASHFFNIAIIEYEKDYLSSVGLTASELARPLELKKIRNSRSGHEENYTKQFSTISRVDVTVDSVELKKLEDMMKIMGFAKKGSQYRKDGITIAYQLNTNNSYRLNRVEVNLLNKMPERDIVVSDHLRIQTKGNKADLIFKYN